MRSLSRLPGPLPCAVAFAAAIACCGTARPQRPEGAIADDRSEDVVVGTLGGPVLATAHGRGAPLHTAQTTIWLWTEAAIVPGQQVRVTGRLRAPRGFLAPGSPDRAVLVASRGAQWEMHARALLVLADEPGLTARVWRWAAATQRELGGRIGPAAAATQSELDGRIGPAAASPRAAPPQKDAARAGSERGARAALRGIVIGDRSHIPEDLDARWRAIGIYHVLSVSGLHLAVIAGLLFALLRRLVAASPWGGRTRPARWAAPPALVLAIAYTLVTGAQLATIRALIVITIVLVAQVLDRPIRLVDAIGVAAIAILAWRPQDLHDASFQLSFVAALTLALRPAAPPALELRHRILRAIIRGLATSAWVALTTAPITALHFHQVAAGGVIGNLVLTPLVELLALPLGLAGALAGDVGAPLVTLAVWIVAIVDHGAGLLAPVIPVGTIAIASPLVMACLVAASLWLAARPQRTRTDGVAWVVICVGWSIARTPPPLGALRVTFLDVGQGDAALVELPGGAVWLVDAGGIPGASGAASTAPGRTIERALAVYGHDSIELAILSHPHPDHYLGLAALTVPIGELWAAADEGTGQASGRQSGFGALQAQLAARGTLVTRPLLGSLRTADGVELTVWAPRYQPTAVGAEWLAPDPVRSVNDNSLVVSIRYAGRTILFTGDLELEGEEALVAAGLPQVDIVKVAHHGSRTSSSPVLVAAARPVVAVISCGQANPFGFPAPEVIARWRAVGAEVARTDADGTVTVMVGADGALSIDRYRRPSP